MCFVYDVPILRDLCAACQRPGLGYVNIWRFENCHYTLGVNNVAVPDIAIQSNQYDLAVRFLGKIRLEDGSFRSV